MITTHSLSADAFAALASGAGDSAVIRQLREAQLSKHLMLLHVVTDAASQADPLSPATVAFRAGYRLLIQVQAADPGAVARLLGMPHIGSWTHDCLSCLDGGSLPDFGYLAAVAAAAAVRLGIQFELDVPVRDGRVPLPGLGCLEVGSQSEWISLSSDGECLRVGDHIYVACAALVPDDGSGCTVPHWRGTPLVRAVAYGQTWEVLLETADRYLDRYTLSVLTTMTTVEITNWRQLIQSAWELLVRHHEWAARPIADCVPVLAPLAPRSDLDSATSPAVFGAIATSLPPSPVAMAETLIHEFQHIKLCGLMDMLDLIEPGGETSYAPWREDPRPMGGLLQGAYAFAGIVRFWNAQRHIETEPDDILRANVLYERWRSAIELVTGTLLEKGFLTPAGAYIVTALRERAQDQEGAVPVPDDAVEIAREITLDNWLTWQFRHTAIDTADVRGLVAAYRCGESPGRQALPGAWIEDNIRTVNSAARSRLLNMRCQDPQGYRQLTTADLADLSTADAFLVQENANAAVAAYRERLAAEPDPAAWLGLALAIHRLPTMSSRSVFASLLPWLFEMHICLADQGIQVDPLDMAAWFE